MSVRAFAASAAPAEPSTMMVASTATVRNDLIAPSLLSSQVPTVRSSLPMVVLGPSSSGGVGLLPRTGLPSSFVEDALIVALQNFRLGIRGEQFPERLVHLVNGVVGLGIRGGHHVRTEQ